MKMNFMKKISILCLSITLIVSNSNIIFAESTEAEEFKKSLVSTETITQIIDDYVASVMPGYLDINGFNSTSEISISKGITIKNWDSNKDTKVIYFVIKNSKVIGKLLVNKSEDGSFQSSFDMDDLTEFEECIKADKEFVLGSSKGRLVLYKDKKFNNLEDVNSLGNVSIDEIKIEEKNFNKIKKNSILTNKIKNHKNSVRAMSLTTHVLDVPFTSNSTINGVGICWAASVASIVNYLKGMTYDAKTIYYIVAATNVLVGGDSPAGNVECIKKAFSLCGAPVNQGSNLSFSSVSSVLGTNQPIYMSLYDSKANVGHGVVLKGAVYLGTSNSFYLLMDPNKSSTVSVALSSSALESGSSFTYVTSNYTYRWRYSFY